MALARRCHDMAKQAYDNKRYSPLAWQPLQQWLNPPSNRVKMTRLQKLRTFTRHDTDLITVFADCLWNLANLPNLPWGRGITPQSYSQIRPTEKVVRNLRLRLWFFFFVTCVVYTYMCPPCAVLHVTQAWAVACAVRRFLGMNPTMNILSFKKDVS